VWVRSRYANNAPEFQSQRGVLRERAGAYDIDNFGCCLSRAYAISDKEENRKDEKHVTMKQ